MTTANPLRVVAILVLPPVAALALMVLGTATKYLGSTNLLILLIAASAGVCAFVAAIGRNIISACASAISSALIIFLLIPREEKVQAYFYDAVILVGGDQFRRACVPENGLIVGQSIFQMCKEYNFDHAGFAYLIVRVEPPSDQVFDGIYQQHIPETTLNDLAKLAGIWPQNFTARKLVENYYLVTVYVGAPKPVNCTPICS